MTDVEQWKEIKFAPNYAVSTFGRVRRIKGGQGARPMLLRQRDWNTAGYPRVRLSHGGKVSRYPVHRLVALTFLGEPPSGKHMVCHNDGNKENNRLGNLRWGTCKENHADREKHGNTPRGGKNGRAKISAADVLFIRASDSSMAELGRMFGVSDMQIRRIKIGESWAHVKAR